MNQSNQRPIMYVFAGNNGSGKSTLRNLLIDKMGIEINIDPDAIAHRLDSDHPESKRFAAGKEAVKMVYECIENKKSFSIETTLGGKTPLDKWKRQKKMNLKFRCFLSVSDTLTKI